METLLLNLDKVHTTTLGKERLKKNLNLNTGDVVSEIKNIILDKNCRIYKRGKNYYCQINNMIVTINSYSYTIITAHVINS